MTNDLHLKIEELLGAYALDAVDADERQTVESHLATCPSCRAEVDQHREVVAILADSSMAPSDEVWEAIIARVEGSRSEVISLPARRARSSRAMHWIAGIAASVAVVLGVVIGVQSSRIGDLDARLAAQSDQITELSTSLQTDPLRRAANEAVETPGAVRASLTAEGTQDAMSIVVLPDGTGFVYESTLEVLPDGSTYQLWAVVDGRVISAGVLGNHPDVVPFHVDPEGLQGLVITREVAGGVLQSEADPVVAWFDA